MKSRLILSAVFVAIGFTSCSVYRSGQTPDDIYYSPGQNNSARGSSSGNGDDDYVDVRERQSSRYNRNDSYYDDYYPEDAYLRMRVRNPSRWSMFDNYGWNDWNYYNSFAFGGGYYPGGGFGSFYNPWNPYYGGLGMGWNSYYYWNSHYNPYCPGIIVVNPKTNPAMYTKLRNFSMAGYNSTAYSNGKGGSLPGKYGRPNYYRSGGGYNNTNRSSSFGGAVRKAFSNSGNSGRSYNNSGSYGNDRPNRTYTPPPTNSNNSSYGRGSSGGSMGGSSGGSSGGGGGVSRPGRN